MLDILLAMSAMSRQELEALKESTAISERNAKLTESELKQKLLELHQ